MTDPSTLTAAGMVRLRRACPEDKAFAEALYLAMTEVLLPKQSETDTRHRFEVVYGQDQSWIVVLDVRDIGWLQIEDGSGEITLRQIHLVAAYQGMGIGGALMEELLSQAQAESKPVTLHVLQGNPALALYERLGFRIVGRDEPRLHMRWEPGQPSVAAAQVSR